MPQTVAPNGASFHSARIPWLPLPADQSQVRRGSSAAFSLNHTQSINGNQMQPSPIDSLCLFPMCLMETWPWEFLLPPNNTVLLPSRSRPAEPSARMAACPAAPSSSSRASRPGRGLRGMGSAVPHVTLLTSSRVTLGRWRQLGEPQFPPVNTRLKAQLPVGCPEDSARSGVDLQAWSSWKLILLVL